MGEAGLTEVAEHEHLAAVPGQKDQSAAAEHLVGEAGLTDHEVAEHEHLAAVPGQKDQADAVAIVQNLECKWN